MTEITRISIVGAGLMGHGIAHVFASAGFPVAIWDPDDEALRTVPERVNQICVLLDHDPRCASQIALHSSLKDAVSAANVVIEAAPEKLAMKRHIFAELEQATSPSTILATNTSVIPISQIAQDVRLKTRVVGTHFWNPPYVIPLVEVVQSAETSPETLDTTIGLLSRVGMKPVHIKKDTPGFVGNRLQHALKREAIALVASGVCDAETVDTVTKLGFGARLGVIGPLEQSDYVGLELTYDIHKVLMPYLDNTPTVHPYLADKVRRGETGMAVGRGFRQWSPEDAGKVKRRLDRFMARAVKSPIDE